VQQTRFEYFVRLRKKTIKPYDLTAIARLSKPPHPDLDIFEKSKILHIIRYKNIKVEDLGYYIAVDDGKSGLIKFNNDRKHVREWLNKDQWILLLDYCRGYTDNMDLLNTAMDEILPKEDGEQNSDI